MWRLLQTLARHFGSNENFINKLAESKPIKRAAQLTVYSYIKAQETAKRSVTEFHRQGGTAKMKQVAKSDLNEGTKIVKEIVTYDLPNMLRNIWKDLRRR